MANNVSANRLKRGTRWQEVTSLSDVISACEDRRAIVHCDRLHHFSQERNEELKLPRNAMNPEKKIH